MIDINNTGVLFLYKLIFRKMGMKNKDENQVDRKINKHPVLYIFSAIILVIIVVTFIGAPIAGKMSGGEKIVFGKYKGKDIEFFPGNYLSKQRDILAQQLDKNDNSNFQLKAYQVWRGAFERTVLHIALLKEVLSGGAVVSQDKIDSTIVKYGPYTVNGEFSVERYNSTSNKEKQDTAKYITESIYKEMYINDFFYGKKNSSKEKDLFIKMAAAQRSVNIVKLPFSLYPDSEVEKFASENIDLFKSMKLSKITVLSGKKDAEKVYSIVTDNADSFTDNAKNYSKDSYSDNGGDMGIVYYYALKTELKNPSDADKIFSLSRNGISPLIETPNGYVMYKSNSEVNSSYKTEEVREYLLKYELGRIEDYLTEKAKLLKTSDNLVAAALKEDYEVIKTEPFPVNFGNNMLMKPVQIKNGGNELSNIQYNEDFFLNAFSLEKGEISDPLVLSDSIVVMNIDDIIESSESDFIINSYFPYIVQQIDDTTLSTFFITSDNLVDNFNETFSKYFISN